MRQETRLEMTSAALHVLAMVLMLCDHLWATVIPGNEWLTCVGRLAFPVFAFLIVEGVHYTRDLKKYALRLFCFALLSEIPFNLVAGGSIFYPFHQNVLWTFLISLGLIRLNGSVKERNAAVRALTAGATVLLGYIVGVITMVDYYHAGILTVLAFYFFRGNGWQHRAGQFLALAYINLELLGGLSYELSLFGATVFLPQQGLALLALIPIWLYRGRQGHHSRGFRLLCYGFYPLHLLILGLVSING